MSPPNEPRATNQRSGTKIDPRQRPLVGLRWALVGPGRVGASFAWWLYALGAELERIAGRRPPAHDLPPEAPSDRHFLPIEALETGHLDLLVVAVSDPAIESVAETLSRKPQAAVVLHVSGHYDAEILRALRAVPGDRREAATAIGSLHPLRAFPSVSRSPDDAEGLIFAIDGDPRARDLASGLASALGGRAFEIAGERRLAYHLAASLAAGGVMTVLAAAEELAREAGLPPGIVPAYLDLARGAMDRVTDASGRSVAHTDPGWPAARVAAAITGPMARDDRPVLERQRQALGRIAPDLLPLFDTLCDETRRQTQRNAAVPVSGTPEQQGNALGQERSDAESNDEDTDSGAETE